MAFYGPKRGRSTKSVSLRLTSAQSDDFRSRLRDRSVWLRLLFCLAAITVIIVSLQGWKRPFPFRLAQQPPFGVVAAIKFQQVNRSLTARAKERAAERVPFIFKNDPEPLTRLPEEFNASLQLVGQADSLMQVSKEGQADFGLLESGTASASGPRVNSEESFRKLKELTGNDETLKKVIAALGDFLEPLKRKGLVRPGHLPPEMGVADSASIVGPKGTREAALLTEIQIPQLLAPTGLLFARWAEFPELLPYRPEIERWLAVRTPETLHYDGVLTQAVRQAERDAVKDVPDVYNRGDILVRPGELIDETRLTLLRSEYDANEQATTFAQRVVRVGSVFLLLSVLAGLNGYYIVRNAPRLARSTGRLGVYLTLIVLTVAISNGLSFDPWRAKVGPVLAAVMLLAIAYDQVLATITAFTLSLILTLSTGGDVSQFVILMGVSTTAVILLPSVSSRSTLVIVGMYAAVSYLLMYWGTAMLSWGVDFVSETPSSEALWSSLFQSLRGAGWCLAAGFLVSGSLPFIESAFGVVTDISLLELGDVSHPLLQELVRRAPGTYNHSITVASIGETAADSIGANGLLVRVGAYFHDIGKMLKPHYFVENYIAGGENRHENLAPAMSTLIIIGHVRDGADLAHQHSLPLPLIDFIEQHHGTTLVEYFFHEAAKQADRQPDHRTDAEESHFRYPGPKPQTREAAVMMMADAVEGASRALSEPTPKRIERLVHDIALKRLLDGQFDECGLTITELSAVEDSLTKSLIAMYHARIKYPEQRTA